MDHINPNCPPMQDAGAPLATRSFAVVGVARNCAGSIEGEVQRLAAALGGARYLRWLVVESDSQDDTVAKLAALARQVPGFDYLSLGSLREALPQRTARLAHCRNAYVEQLRAGGRLADVDFVVVADLDGVNTLLTTGALQSCFTRDDWDACTANQRGPYYDIWALRHPQWNPGDCWAQYRFLEGFEPNTERNIGSSVYDRMIRLPEDAGWIEVESAFGGLAVYRRGLFDTARYEGLDATGTEQCEHVTLHAAMRSQGARIFINPGLVNAGMTEHSAPLRAGPALRREARALAKSAAVKLLGVQRALRLRAQRRSRRGD
jgi:hypothetical protein